MWHAPFCFKEGDCMADELKRQRIYVAVKGVVLRDGRALIVRRSDAETPNGLGWWEFPGGTLEFGESPGQTLVREMKEETGLNITPDRLLYVWSAQNAPDCQIIIITYLCNCEGIENLRLSKEHLGYMWADKADLHKFLAADIQNALDANNVWNVFE